MTHDAAVRTLAAERYLLDEMSELERHEFEDHYFECQECASDLRSGASLATAARSAGTARSEIPGAGNSIEPATVVKLRPRGVAAVVVPLAAAALFAIVAGYQAFVMMPALRARLAPRLVAPVILTPATRGETVVISPAGAAPLVLSLDVNLAPSSGELVYDVRREAGERVITGRVPVPLPGTPLLLFLAEAPAAGTYVVSLRGVEDADAGESSYRFTVR